MRSGFVAAYSPFNSGQDMQSIWLLGSLGMYVASSLRQQADTQLLNPCFDEASDGCQSSRSQACSVATTLQ